MKQGQGDKEVNVDHYTPAGFNAESTWIVAKEIHDLQPGQTVEVDANDNAFPRAFSQAPAGQWEAQAILDVDHSYSYSGRLSKDWQSNVVPVVAGAAPTELTLTEHSPQNASESKLPGMLAAAKPEVAQQVDIQSSSLTQFWGKPTAIHAWVILPPNYDANRRQAYPAVYWTSGFTGDMEYDLETGLRLRKRMDEGKMPPMIWVMLDQSIPQGMHEFADSVNDGPWGTALTTEFIPQLEKRYRLDARPNARFLTGKSSGDWSSLQLEINYPNVFGGTWSISPDPSDFHSFIGVDLYAPNANIYRRPDGTPAPFWRGQDKVVVTTEQFVKLEDVQGTYGGQYASFEWVFSPKGPSGAPEPMFDRETGEVYPEVVQYWRDHYDLAYLAEKNWPQNGPMLKGRIHLYVGTADNFYLDASAHLMEARLNKLGADPHFTYVPGKTHFDIYYTGKDADGLFDEIAAQMYSIAKPHEVWKAQASTQAK